jgi:DNA-binding MarR family transcriptional regulator
MAETRWLTEDEQAAWRSYLFGYRALFDALDRQLQVENGIPHAYYEILAPLSEVEGRSMRMSELATLTYSSRSRLSHAVSRLEEKGWVRREDCETDRRGQLAVLTDAGYEVVLNAAPGHVAAVRRFLIDQLTPEQLRAMKEVGDIALTTAAAEDLPARPR